MSTPSSLSKFLTFLILGSLIGLTSSACQGGLATTPQDAITGSPATTDDPPEVFITPAQAVVTQSPVPLDTAAATDVIHLDQNPPTSNPTRAPAPAIDALQFIFPTPGPAPVSAWRPPLYPTPWALTPNDHFYFARPIAADEINWPLWDYRYGGVFFANVVHTGVDITAPKGTPVLATGSGEVVWAGYGLYRGGNDPKDPYGLAVAIHHDFGYQDQALYTIYGHMDKIDVAEGQYVEVGDVLGLVGETGEVTGPHLHYEVRVGRNDFFSTRNPELWMVPPQGWGVLAGLVTDSAGQLKHSQDIIVHSLSSGQNWLAKSYGPEAVNRDPFYQENVVVGDLPAGKYEIRIPYAGKNYLLEIEIFPGLVNFFTFQGFSGFTSGLPPTPEGEFTPPPYQGGATPIP